MGKKTNKKNSREYSVVIHRENGTVWNSGQRFPTYERAMKEIQRILPLCETHGSFPEVVGV